MDSDEIICSCLDITKGMIEEAVNNGAKTLEDVQEVNSVGTICGACIEDVEQLIAELTAK
ncbi:MAG: (2Fe-2S)-binding protein [Eubacterium sp.]|nr:(2Fe-2S)-binding protein [Eubacterium sp.]MCI8919264.1 (2Fe-2S)-binding protein [Eubacterium sp.]